MRVDIKYEYGEYVYLKTDPLQERRMVTGVLLRPHSSVVYYLSLGSLESTHYEIEISREKDYTSF